MVLQCGQSYRIQQCHSVYKIKTEELQQVLELKFEIPTFSELYCRAVYIRASIAQSLKLLFHF